MEGQGTPCMAGDGGCVPRGTPCRWLGGGRAGSPHPLPDKAPAAGHPGSIALTGDREQLVMEYSWGYSQELLR